jgi:hypothetical protein
MTDNQQPTIVSVNLLVGILAGIAIILRVLARRIRNLPLESDDMTIIVALVSIMESLPVIHLNFDIRQPLSWSICACNIVGMLSVKGLSHLCLVTEFWITSFDIRAWKTHRHPNLCRHYPWSTGKIAALTLRFIPNQRGSKIFFASQLLWAVAIPIIKISILLLYTRIFGVLSYFRYTAYILGVFLFLWGIMVVFVVSLACRPLKYTWDKSGEGSCINATVFYIIGSGLNVITDFITLFLPLHAVWYLQSSIQQKLLLTGVFLLGSLWVLLNVNQER